ncbi:unnamed protein product [Ambrosiozyma monospora]|uniref:Unnamed protein product n=1 Tax=Ambrosiozyma monospora TaxID=43982 RepID=A0ACB5UB12_AMBMO|nr:unnamed protein product [Ambrosiozyma monospora]
MSATAKSLLRPRKNGSQMKQLMGATAQCATQSTAYGQCILKHYENINKDVCAAEFQVFKQCVQEHLGKKW